MFDEDYWMKACVALSAKEVTLNERCYGGNYYEVPRGAVRCKTLEFVKSYMASKMKM